MAEHKRVRVGLTCAALLFSVGCVPALKDNPPREANKLVPEGFGGQAIGDAAVPAGNVADQRYDQYFPDAELRGLIQSALANNQELNLRLQEIMIARAEVLSRQGEYLPRVDAQVGAGIEKRGSWTSQGRNDERTGVPEHLQNYTFGLRASWEVDIFKRLRNAAKAANLRYLATVEGRNFMVTQLIAEIATTYYDLIALDNRLEVLNRNIAIQTNALQMVKLQKEAARVTQLAVQRFEAEVLKNRSRQFELEQERIEAENRINFLLGRYPQPVARSGKSFDAPAPSVIASGIPAALLDHRPDVRAAELELEASKLDVKSARAAFYPALSIEAGVGYETFNLKHLVTTPESLLYNLAGNLTAPLLNRKAIKAQYAAANARQLQAVFNYERTLLNAFTEVVNNLARVHNLQKSYELRSQQVTSLTQSIEISNVLFQSARADYMEVLLTRRDSLDAEMELIETKNRQMQALVDIYQALGGGWQQTPKTPSEPPSERAPEPPPPDAAGAAPPAAPPPAAPPPAAPSVPSQLQPPQPPPPAPQ